MHAIRCVIITEVCINKHVMCDLLLKTVDRGVRFKERFVSLRCFFPPQFATLKTQSHLYFIGILLYYYYAMLLWNVRKRMHGFLFYFIFRNGTLKSVAGLWIQPIWLNALNNCHINFNCKSFRVALSLLCSSFAKSFSTIIQKHWVQVRLDFGWGIPS